MRGERIGGIDKWYEKQKTYWDGQPTTIDGVLGGYEKYHVMESDYSEVVFNKYKDYLPGKSRAFEVGAGIGRISKTLLVNHFEKIDLND